MNTMLDVLSGAAWQHLTVALLHTLWQGVVVAAILWITLRWIPAHRANARYAAAFAALLGIVICGLASWSVLDIAQPVSRKVAASNRVQPSMAPVTAQGVSPSRGLAQASSDDHGVVPEITALENDSVEDRPMWLAWLTAGWLLGVVLMGGRLAWTVAHLRRLSRGPEVRDPLIRQWTDELQCLLGIRRLLRIVEVAEGIGPAVFGVVRPVLALPVSMMTGLPPEAIRAVLAHELAHLRRYDYWFNLVQMAIEAVLFFNPAVWWISRQVRIEREACCDAMAARLLGQPLALAEALSLWAERVRASRGVAVVAAFAASGPCGPRLLLDRVKRLLLPGYRPQLPVSPLGFFGMLLGSVAVLTTLACGTRAIVNLALTPKERIERVEQAERHFAPKPVAEGNVTIKGMIRARDGKPLPKAVKLSSILDMHGGPIEDCYDDRTRTITPPSFSLTVPARTVRLVANAEGYAPSIVDLPDNMTKESHPNIEVVLDKGEPRTIRVVDENSQPVAGVKVEGSFECEGFAIDLGEYRTDKQGCCVIRVPSSVVSSQWRFKMFKHGFQSLYESSIVPHPKAGTPTTLVLPRAKPVMGQILSHAGQPVAGAKLRNCAQTISGPFRGGTCYHGTDGPVLAVTDKHGQFALDTLEDNVSYLIVAESEKDGRLPFLVRSPTSERFSLRFGPLLTVTGVVRGPLDQLLKLRTNNKPVVTFSQDDIWLSQGVGQNVFRDGAVVESVDGQQRFTIRGLLPGNVEISAGRHYVSQVHTTVNAKTPHQHVKIDLLEAERLQRPAIFRVTTPDNQPLTGTLYLRTTWSVYDYRKSESLSVENGIARTNVYVGDKIEFGPEGFKGYWFPLKSQVIGRGQKPQEPLEIVVYAIPAGAIVGQVFNPDGKPCPDEKIEIGVDCVLKYATPDGYFGQSGFFNRTGAIESGTWSYVRFRVNPQGRFFISPAPIGGKYLVSATRGHVVCRSPAITLTGAKPMVQISLFMPRTAVAEGRVLDPAGRPLAVPIDLGLWYAKYTTGDPGSGGQRWPGEKTDRHGRFRFDDLGVGIGEYYLEIKPEQDFQPCRIPIPLDGKPIEVRLKPHKH